MDKDEYLKRTHSRISRRDAIIRQFLDHAAVLDLIDCENCNSVISVPHASRTYIFTHEAKCLVCRETLLSKDAQKELTQMWHDGDKDYHAYRSKYPLDQNNQDSIVPIKSTYSWTSVLPKDTVNSEKPKWWQRIISKIRK